MTNFLGILAQGLRIAPAEAPAHGFMFGKGLYFADTFSKSSQYSSGHSSSLVLLCDVALGNSLKLYDAK
jgi:poly [ADP-ribose] polymerase 2/3/4